MNDMRRFLNAVDAPSQPATKKFAFFGSLLEGRADQYKQMFAPLDALVDLEHADPRARSTLNTYMQIALSMKRDDRIVWALKQFRNIFVVAWASLHHNERLEAEYPNAAAICKKFGSPLPPFNDGRDNKQMIMEIASHYLAIPYSKIQNYVFPPSATPFEITTTLAAFEKEFKERAKGLVTQQPGDKIIMTFPNGMIWMHLSRGGCAEEAAAMGHCGNGYGAAGQSILSLRKLRKEIDGEKFYEPFPTFSRKIPQNLSC